VILVKGKSQRLPGKNFMDWDGKELWESNHEGRVINVQ